MALDLKTLQDSSEDKSEVIYTFFMLANSMTNERSLAYHKRTNYAGAKSTKVSAQNVFFNCTIQSMAANESKSRKLTDGN